jgi:hypothetical protein
MKKGYLRVAERSLDAADSALASKIHEKAAFLSYHAFESCGSALGSHIGLDMGKTVSHATKLKRFNHSAKKVGLGKEVALLSIRLGSMRNRLLYPEILPDGSIVTPEQQITRAKAAQLAKEVKSMVKKVGTKL